MGPCIENDLDLMDRGDLPESQREQHVTKTARAFLLEQQNNTSLEEFIDEKNASHNMVLEQTRAEAARRDQEQDMSRQARDMDATEQAG